MPIQICSRRYGSQYREDATWILTFVENLCVAFDMPFTCALDWYGSFVKKKIDTLRAFNRMGQPGYGFLGEPDASTDTEEFQKQSLVNLALSYVLAPHRHEMLRFTRNSLAEHLNAGDRCLDIGMGTGIEVFLADRSGCRLDAYDINPHSPTCLRLLGVSERVRFHEHVYTFTEPASFDLCILLEVLEHVRDPLELLRGVESVLMPSGIVIASFALRMPQADHIYQFSSVSQVRQMVGMTNLMILKEDYLIATFLGYDESRKEALAEKSKFSANYVCVLEKPQAAAC